MTAQERRDRHEKYRKAIVQASLTGILSDGMAEAAIRLADEEIEEAVKKCPCGGTDDALFNRYQNVYYRILTEAAPVEGSHPYTTGWNDAMAVIRRVCMEEKKL